jgi:hypothetical protein
MLTRSLRHYTLCASTAIALLLLAAALPGCRGGGDTILGAAIHSKEFFSQTFRVRGLYPSMQGPARTRPLPISADASDLIWITNTRMEVVDMDGMPMESQDNLCHANVRSRYMGAEWVEHNVETFGGARHLPAKWFTLVAGQLSLDFPEGFGIPMLSDEPIEAYTMILNNDPDFEPFDFRVRTQVDYVLDRDVDRPMRALGRTGFQNMVYVDAGEGEDHDHAAHAESCGLDDDDVVRSAAKPAGPEPVVYPGERESVMHWMVPPGRHAYRDRHKLAGLPDGLPYVNAHYITAHLHVYGETVEFVDVTEGKTVFTSAATSNEKRTAVVDMTSWSSTEGIPLFLDHEYELISTYNNTTDHEIDAMGVIYIYFENPLFQAARVAGMPIPASPRPGT